MKTLFYAFFMLFGLSVSAQWTASSLPGPGLGREIYLTSSTTGFITSFNQNSSSTLDAYIYKTTNGGTSWTNVKTLLGTTAVWPYQSYSIEDLHFVNSTTGYGAGTNYVYAFLCKTTDGGNTWDTTTFSSITQGFDCLYFTDVNTGYFGGTDGTIYKTTDAGVTISAIGGATPGGVNDIEFVNSTTGFVVSDMDGSNNQSKIMMTTNAGTTWNTVHTVNNANVTSISMANQTTGYAMTNNGTLLKTTNGGTTWVASTPFTGISVTWEVHTVSPTILYVSGVTSSFNRVILKSTNGGTTWTTDYSEMSVTLFYNFTFSGSTAMAISSDNYVKTTSAPTTIEENYLNNIIDIYPNPVSHILKLDLPSEISASNVKIYNSSAKLVIDETTNFNHINIESLANGIYLLNIENDSQIIYSTKFIKN